MASPKAYLELIDSKYQSARKEGLSRMSIKWGKWSTEMNREIRAKIQANHPQKTRLIYVQNYWQIKSQLLEIYYKRITLPFFGLLKKKKLEREAKKIKKIIISGKIPKI